MKPKTVQPEPSGSKPGSKPNARDALKSLPLPQLQAKLGSSPDGLTQAQAQRRLTQYGPNKLEVKKTNLLLKFLSCFWGPIPWLIEAALILSAVARHWLDFFILLVLLLANAVVGFWEEHQPGNAIAALKAELAKGRVKRDGNRITPAAREVVPGDVIRVRLGDIVPAHARFLRRDPVEVDQPAFTRRILAARAQIGRQDKAKETVTRQSMKTPTQSPRCLFTPGAAGRQPHAGESGRVVLLPEPKRSYETQIVAL